MSKLKTYILLALFIAISSRAHSEPKLILTKNGVAEIRAQLNQLPLLQSSLQKAVDLVEGEMTKGIDVPVPKDMAGGYTHNRHKKNFLVLQKAGVLFQITQEEKHTIYVRNMLMAYAKMYPTLGLNPFALVDYDENTLRAAIAHERRVELAMESHRWFDLGRTGKAQQVMSAHGTEEDFTYESFRELYPIPQREIDVSDGYLVQNSNY